jgi:cyclophilin family peptidyl-prolyl cis-trans isomerase
MRKVLILLVTLFLITGVTGCSSATDDEQKSETAKKQTEEKAEGEVLEPLKEFTGPEYVDPKGKIAVIETSMGTFKVEFFPEVAPNTVQSFIHLANKGFYNGLTFHRVIDGFVIQGGCPVGNGTGGPGYRLKAEFNELNHELGVLSMARSADPDSAGSQFFVCLGDVPHLDNKYTVFGGTIEGIDVVKAIGKVATDQNDAPLEKVIIKSIKIEDKK